MEATRTPSALPELEQLEALVTEAAGALDVRVACEVAHQGRTLPVYVLALGSDDPGVPAVGFFGGVHGLERIGARVVIAYLHSLVRRLPWDVALHGLLQQVRLVFMPLVNPGGMARGTRANPAGVDLMRNAPVEALDAVPFLVGGQRIGAGLPWYRGRLDAPMEPESRALCDVVQRELLARPFSVAVDCHSGFGMRDRLWFPYAHCRTPIAHLAQLHALHEIFRETHAYHPYVFEPQSHQYLAHGDLWDHLYRNACEGADRVFLPLTLEMGSWLWVKKNPRQLFSVGGMFNPLIAHREHRVLRRHVPLLEFLIHAAAGHSHWLPQGDAEARHRRQALARWYGGRP